MTSDASDGGKASAIPPGATAPILSSASSKRPGFGPAWLVCALALSFLAAQRFYLPALTDVDASGLIAEASVLLIHLAGLFVIQQLRPTPPIYWPMQAGLTLLVFAHLADVLDEIRLQPNALGILVEDAFSVLGYTLLVLGLVRWLRFNQRILAENQVWRIALEQRVAERTATLEAEIAKRQCAEKGLRESEGRYRELNAALEQRVAERTDELHIANATLREREASLNFIIEGGRLGTWNWDITTGKVQRNDYWAEMLGFSPTDIDDDTLRIWLELIHPEDRQRARRSLGDRLVGATAMHEVEYRMRTAAGTYRWILDRARIVLRNAEGQPLRMSGTLQDITDRKQTEIRLRQSEERSRLFTKHAVDNIWIMDSRRRLNYVSPSIESLVGFTPEEYQELTLEEQIMPGSLAVAQAYLDDLSERIATGRSVLDCPFRGEIELRARDGSGVWTEIIATPIVDDQDQMLELAGVTRDIRERRRYEAALTKAEADTQQANRAIRSANLELQRLASTDRLTGTWNRLYFERAANEEIEKAAYDGQPLSLVILDIDHFKQINDTHGHLAGDQVLLEISRMIGEQLRAPDVLARWGGEEFVILLPQSGLAQALTVAEKLRLLLHAKGAAKIGAVTASFGVASLEPGETLDDWLKRADRALYAAKASGRNRVCQADSANEVISPSCLAG